MKIFRFASPVVFYQLAGKLWAKFAIIAFALTAVGLYLGLFVAPTDFQQGEVYRIIFIHVPASWMSMFIYIVMAFWSILCLSFQTRLSGIMTKSLAPTGAIFTFLSLITGSLWGKPTWGTWWIWDARLTSELILFFLYISYIALTKAIEDPRRSERAGSIVAIVGVINVPIIYFSVIWWNSLHQGVSLSMKKGSSIDSSMLYAMLIMALAFWAYTIAISLYRVRGLILWREQQHLWVQNILKGNSS